MIKFAHIADTHLDLVELKFNGLEKQSGGYDMLDLYKTMRTYYG